MNTNDNNKLLEEPLNFTDPYVLHDYAYERGLIPQMYNRSDSLVGREDDSEDEGPYIDTINDHDTEYTAGIEYPIVQINNRVIDYTQIYTMYIMYDNFLPKIIITLDDYNEDVQSNDIPGLNNSIKVVIVPKVNNVYKTLYLEFKIIKCDIENSKVTYQGIYNFIPFNKSLNREFVYNGCSNENCNSEPNETPNTWEFIHAIAIESGLGFSSTDECKNIEDRLPRILCSERLDQAIPRQISWGGLDEYSIFDCWVDLYGTLTLVNVAWVLEHANILPENLSTKAFVGINTSDYYGTKEKCIEVNRTLTNYIGTGTFSNLIINNYTTIVNNKSLQSGTSMHAMNFNLRDVNGGNNSISQHDIEMKQNSIDGEKMEEYEVEDVVFFTECNSLPINKQKIIRDKFFSKHRQRILEVELDELNLGLQRGTLINLAIFTSNPTHKRKILLNSKNVVSENSDINPDKSNDEDDDVMQIINDSTQILNPALSGMYYIDYMRFEYSYEDNKIFQYLGLIKRGSTSGLDNKYTSPVINPS